MFIIVSHNICQWKVFFLFCFFQEVEEKDPG